MRYPILLIADLHFTSNPRDEYRWGLWPWMRAQCKERGVNSVCFLGDLSDAKDFHPASLVNRLAREARETSELAREYFIPGNHEWLKQGEEFWRFLALMGDRIHYFTRPSDDPAPHRDGPTVRFLPFTKTPARDWSTMSTLEDYDLVFMHQTVRGSRSSNGEEMDGEDVPLDLLRTARKVYSGDIHVPQVVDCVEYVGSPYHVHFGDKFAPRCVLLEGPQALRSPVDLRFPSISRVTIDATDLEAVASHAGDLRRGDQVKLRMHLEPSEKHEWRRIRREAHAILRDAGVEVHGLELLVQAGASRRRLTEHDEPSRDRTSPQDDLLRYVEREELGPDALDAGLEAMGC